MLTVLIDREMKLFPSDIAPIKPMYPALASVELALPNRANTLQDPSWREWIDCLMDSWRGVCGLKRLEYMPALNQQAEEVKHSRGAHSCLSFIPRPSFTAYS